MAFGRYLQVLALVDRFKPATIAEIGTWNGGRAMEMAAIALKHRSQVKYIGFDLFEEATSETDQRELNVKKHHSLDEVTTRLNAFAGMNPGFTFELHRGNTNDVLFDLSVDFVFLDGGHSIETIENDFRMVRNSKVIVLDDYYTGPIDTNRFGCNRLVGGLQNCQVLPTRDPVAGGGFTQVVLHLPMGMPS
jgi:hypothetical protein